MRQHWEYLRTQKDLSDPTVVARIYRDGVPEAHMADVIDREFTRRGQKALVFCGTQHIFTRYHSAAYEKNASEMKLPETRRMGNIVFDRIGAQVFSVSLHAPWPDPAQATGLNWPVNGAIDALIDALPADKKSGGWDTAGTPLGALRLAKSAYSDGEPNATLSDLFDGYIVQGPIGEYTLVTPIRDFVQPADAERAGQEFPGVKPPSPPSADQVNQTIAEDLASLAKALTQFK